MLMHRIVMHLLAENDPLMGNFTMRKRKMVRVGY